MLKASELYGLDIYDEGGRHIGKVFDLIINLEKGEIVRITTEPLRRVSRELAAEILRKKSILYKRVKSVGDIVIVGRE